MALVYATTMVLLDRYLVLPEWLRQVALAGFLLAAGAAAYLFIVRPLRREINPLYAAVKVEKANDDAKNSLAGDGGAGRPLGGEGRPEPGRRSSQPALRRRRRRRLPAGAGDPVLRLRVQPVRLGARPHVRPVLVRPDRHPHPAADHPARPGRP